MIGPSVVNVMVESGKVLSCGRARYGVLGHGVESTGHRSEAETVPRVMTALDNLSIIDIAAGANHALCISSAGVVYAWGRGAGGRLGFSSTEDVSHPVPVPNLVHVRPFKAVACGENHSVVLTGMSACALSAPPDVSCCESEERSSQRSHDVVCICVAAGAVYQFGRVGSSYYALPTQVTGGEFDQAEIVDISCGSTFCQALDGTSCPCVAAAVELSSHLTAVWFGGWDSPRTCVCVGLQ